MSEAEVLPEGGAPLPPKRPTIIRPSQDGRGPVPARPAPARPAPPPPGAKPSPVAPSPAAAGASGPASNAVLQRPSAAVPAPVATKQPERGAAKQSSMKGKSQGSVRKRPEITIVDARPMSQAGFRDMKVSDTAPVTAAVGNSAERKEEKTVKQPSSNGGLPAIPSRPPPASSTTPHSTPPPAHSPPPIPTSRPGAPPSIPPPPHPEKPAPDQPQTQDPEPPHRPSRPTILRPARPKSAIVTGNPSLEDSARSPPPPLPKRSPIVSDTSAPGDLIDFNPPPKPARVIQGSEELQADQKEAEGGEKGEGHIAPQKPTRTSIIRPPRRPKSMIDAAPESNDEPQEGGSQHLPRPKPPPPDSRPVAIVSASPKDASETDATQPGVDGDQTKTVSRPVPAARLRGSPKEGPQEELKNHTSPVVSPRFAHGSSSEQSTKQSQHADTDKTQGAPDRPKPPVPASRPQGPPPAVPNAGTSPRLSQKMVPSKPAPPGAVGSAPTSLPSGSAKESGLPPPLMPSKPPAATGVVPTAEGCLYAVSEPLEDTDSFTRLSPPESQPSRPPPPVPKTRPRSIAQSSPMLGRPLPSVPGSSGDTPLSDQPQCYEDIDSVKAQAQNSVQVAVQEDSLSPLQNAEVVGEGKCEEDVSAMYATVNKPNKLKISQNSDSSDTAASNPFGVRLKHIPPEDSPESEPPPVPPKLGSDELDELSAPVVSPKPKPSVSVKPQVAAKPKSPRKEEVPLEPSEVSPKPESSEQKKPPLAAKRPTIIRAPKPAPKSESVASSNDSEDKVESQMRVTAKQEIPQPAAELSSNGENKNSATGRPAPPRRPVTIIGMPQQRQKAPEKEEGTCPQPVPGLPNSDESSSGAEKSGVNEEVPGAQTTTQPPPHTSPALSRPPPPRSGKPDLPDPPPASRRESDSGSSAPPRPLSSAPPRPVARPAPPRATSDKKEGGEGVPDKPPSPAPPRPSTRPSPAAANAGEEEGGATVAELSSSLESSPPVSKRNPSQSEEETVQQRPRPTGGPPPRPMSMPPARPLPSADKTEPSSAAATADPKQEKPSKPQPARPSLPKPSQPSTPPPLPHRPSLSHPLYHYMAGEPHAIAVHSYPAQQADELAFEEGDTVVLLKRVDEQWLMGRVGDKEGIFPHTFVHIIHPLHDELPPSALDDVIDSMFEDALQEKPDLLQGPRCRARFDFEGEGQDDLAFEDGDVIQLIDRCGEDWLKGELSGKRGIFPAAFVEIIEDLPEAAGWTTGVEGEGEQEVTALFDFNGHEGELSFEAGDKIRILSRVDEQWLFGECRGREGSFPAAFVEDVPQDLPTPSPQAAAPHSSASASGPQPSLAPPTAGMQNKPEQWGTALHSFEKMQEGDLGFSEGDRILILDEVGQDWLKGRLGDQEGLFPAVFIQMDSAEQGMEVQETLEMQDHGTGLSAHSALVKGRALYDYEGQAEDELSFKVDDEIVLGSMVSEGSEWQWGELNGKKGIFPASFVDMI